MRSTRPYSILFSLVSMVAFLAINSALKTLSEKKEDKKRYSNFNLSDVKKKIKPVADLKQKPPPPNKTKKSVQPQLNSQLLSTSFDLGLDTLGFNFSESDLLEKSKGAPLTEDLVDKKPEVSYQPPPEFPEEAKGSVSEGYVKAQMLINSQGQVEKIKILESQPQGVFEDVVLSALRAWMFTPAEYKGQKVSVWMSQIVRFKN